MNKYFILGSFVSVFAYPVIQLIRLRTSNLHDWLAVNKPQETLDWKLSKDDIDSNDGIKGALLVNIVFVIIIFVKIIRMKRSQEELIRSNQNLVREIVNLSERIVELQSQQVESASTSNLNQPRSSVEMPTCEICAAPYDSVRNIPKVLGCGHTVCLPCLRSIHSRLPQPFLCPFDRRVIKLTNRGVEGLPNNFTLMEQLR